MQRLNSSFRKFYYWYRGPTGQKSITLALASAKYHSLVWPGAETSLPIRRNTIAIALIPSKIKKTPRDVRSLLPSCLCVQSNSDWVPAGKAFSSENRVPLLWLAYAPLIYFLELTRVFNSTIATWTFRFII